MGAMKDLFIKQIEDLGNSKRSRFSFDELMDAWTDWWRKGYCLTQEQPDKPRFNVFIPEGGGDAILQIKTKDLRDFGKELLSLMQKWNGINLHLKEIESLAHSTGYPPNILLGIWLEDLADDNPDWDSFKGSTLELDW